MFSSRAYGNGCNGEPDHPTRDHGLYIKALCNIEALIMRIGFWGHYTIIIIRNHENSIGNYFGPYIKA